MPDPIADAMHAELRRQGRLPAPIEPMTRIDPPQHVRLSIAGAVLEPLAPRAVVVRLRELLGRRGRRP